MPASRGSHKSMPKTPGTPGSPLNFTQNNFSTTKGSKAILPQSKLRQKPLTLAQIAEIEAMKTRG